MKSFASIIFFSVFLCFAYAEPLITKNRFAEQLKKEFHEALVIRRTETGIKIVARTQHPLPLKFIDNRLQTTNGDLVAGDVIMWAGCGGDRTSYTIHTVSETFIDVAYSRGTPQSDGYNDSGGFRVILEK